MSDVISLPAAPRALASSPDPVRGGATLEVAAAAGRAAAELREAADHISSGYVPDVMRRGACAIEGLLAEVAGLRRELIATQGPTDELWMWVELSELWHWCDPRMWVAAYAFCDGLPIRLGTPAEARTWPATEARDGR